MEFRGSRVLCDLLSFILFSLAWILSRMESSAYVAETTSVKDHAVCLFNGQTIEFRERREQIELHLMSYNLYSGI